MAQGLGFVTGAGAPAEGNARSARPRGRAWLRGCVGHAPLAIAGLLRGAGELQAETVSGVESRAMASPRTPAGLSSELVVDLAAVTLEDFSWPAVGRGRVRRGE
jgi:hypothetical protein